ncbi:MAG: nucleotidyltransferase domain-containing protein [Eggerthellaceae bacterium]|nr:nucleotidyltransferase domain-containing protein [Eggerthellaceae bacterium]
MAKSETLQMRLDSDDMRCLRVASARSGMTLSDYVRRELEPSIVSAKIAEIARDFDYITTVTLFGSMARGEQTDDSDVDVAIETDAPYKWMGERGVGRFVARVEEAVGRSVDLVKTKYCSEDLAEEIERSGRTVYAR